MKISTTAERFLVVSNLMECSVNAYKTYRVGRRNGKVTYEPETIPDIKHFLTKHKSFDPKIGFKLSSEVTFDGKNRNILTSHE